MDSPGLFARTTERTMRAAVADAPFECLHGSTLSGRYRSWRGWSGARYVTSVFPVDHGAADRGLPVFDGVVLLAVMRDGRGVSALAVLAVETAADREVALAMASTRGVTEWHVHLLAEDRERRRAVVSDLHLHHVCSAATPLTA